MKNKLSLLILLLLLVGMLTPLFATESGYRKYSKALGFQVGELSGSGLSYQQWNGDFGYQVAFGALYFSPESNQWWMENFLDYSVGLEFQYTVYGDDFANWLSGRLYLFTALNHRGYIPAIYKDIDEDSYTYDYGSFNPIIGVGAGIGIEIILFEHFSMPFELGYGLFWNPTKTALRDQFMINIIPQVGFRYRY